MCNLAIGVEYVLIALFLLRNTGLKSELAIEFLQLSIGDTIYTALYEHHHVFVLPPLKVRIP